ncbi:type-F conjugative transfer system mating-pair stabilization protein TraN [Salmonella enterica subsp. enterica serovar Orientalis]|nr:type-F conjugative transfer system mating-pair stabilization protein TraN [Salmonella enterica subsp. enterica serovar Orientalis]SUF14001.1 conjugal transfer protein TraN [Salmonella enterica]
MKKIFLIALMLTPLLVMAADPGFEAGASFGKDNAAAGSNSLKNPSVVTSAIPGYTDKPPESGYYNGVSGGDGGLNGAGLGSLQGSNAGQAVIDSGNKNPPPVINPDAPFITVGKDAENSAGSIIDGTGQQCQESTVSKTTFENFTCDRDVASIESCKRTASITGDWKNTEEFRYVTIAPNQFRYSMNDHKLVFSVTSPVTGVIQHAQLKVYASFYFLNSRYTFMNTVFNVETITGNTSTHALNGATGMKITEGQELTGTGCTANGNCIYGGNGDSRIYQELAKGASTFTLTLYIKVGEKEWIPRVEWADHCGFAKTRSVSPIESICTAPGGDRTVVVEGKEYTVHSDCWEYQESYAKDTDSVGNCGPLIADKNCTRSNKKCTETDNGVCIHQTETWQCQKTYQSGGLVCGGEFICQNGDCGDTNDAGDNGFDEAVSKLAGLASAAEDVKDGGSDIEVKAFTGKVMRCRKAFAGFSNCCKDSGWGQDIGLSACDDDEKAIGKAKAKKITVKVGERCDKKVLGACIQKSQVYCVFDGKLSRIIQEQGRRDQLGVNFGSGDSPNCRGITVPELQNIDFDLINFSDFYSEMMDNQKIPDSSVMVKQVKDRIAAQVQQQQGQGGKK